MKKIIGSVLIAFSIGMLLLLLSTVFVPPFNAWAVNYFSGMSDHRALFEIFGYVILIVIIGSEGTILRES